MRCFYFGCWNAPGHFLWQPSGDRSFAGIEWWGRKEKRHIDGSLAPRRMRDTDEICWSGMDPVYTTRPTIEYRSNECPQGEFLLHFLDTGFTEIQWWDRCQGDTRGACNSTILFEGRHAADEMLAALAKHFPHVLANLTKAGVTLVEVKV